MDQVVVAVEKISDNTNDISTQIEHLCKQEENTKHARNIMEEHTHRLSEQARQLEELTDRFKLSTQEKTT